MSVRAELTAVNTKPSSPSLPAPGAGLAAGLYAMPLGSGFPTTTSAGNWDFWWRVPEIFSLRFSDSTSGDWGYFDPSVVLMAASGLIRAF